MLGVGGRGTTRRDLGGVRPFAAALGLAVVGSIAVIAAPGPVAAGEVFVVDSTADDGDVNRGDGQCRASSGRCTLRAALEEANATPGHDRIEFRIPGTGPHRIEPQTAYPFIRDGAQAGVTIDGFTQPGARPNTAQHGSNAVIMIELRGTGPMGIDGLYFRSSDNEVRGLALFDFRRHLRFWGDDVRNNVVAGNHVGTDAAGTFLASARNPSGSIPGDAVHIQEGSSGNLIGGPARADRNVLSGSAGRGVGIYNPGTSDNVVRNNLIGLTPDGSGALKNWAHGVDVNYGATDNLIVSNVISGNELSGVEISHNALGEPSHGGTGPTTRNRVVDNRIGTNPAATSGAAHYANGEFGVGLEGRGSCFSSCSPDIDDNEVRGNVILGGQAHVAISRGAHDNRVVDNLLGVLPDGRTRSSATTTWSVLIHSGSFDNDIRDNRITGALNGVQIRPDVLFQIPATSNRFRVDGNTVVGNSISGITPGLGVDLWPVGSVTASPDPNLVQGGVRIGTIQQSTTDRVVVAACGGCSVELFTTPGGGSAYGQGETSLGSSTATSGVATFVFRDDPTDPFVVRVGDLVSALVTDGSGNTSEFSLRRPVSAGSIGTTPTTSTSTTTTTTTTTIPTSTSTTTTTTIPTTTPTVPPTPVDSAIEGRGRAEMPAERCSLSSNC